MTLILVSHADLAQVQGGAHVLLAVAGYNLARFQLAVRPGRGERVRGILRSAARRRRPRLRCGSRAVTVATGDYRWQTAVFLNGLTGTERWTDDWQFWFLEALVWGYLGMAALVRDPVGGPRSRRTRSRSAMAASMTCLVLRYALVGVEAGAVERYQPVVVLWCLALGWAAAVARTPRSVWSSARCGGVDVRVLRRLPARGDRRRRHRAAACRPCGAASRDRGVAPAGGGGGIAVDLPHPMAGVSRRWRRPVIPMSPCSPPSRSASWPTWPMTGSAPGSLGADGLRAWPAGVPLRGSSPQRLPHA